MSNPFIREQTCCAWHRFISEIRYPFCECFFDCKWGRVIEGGCEFHDS